MLDKVFAAISMLGVVAFMGVVIIGVWEPDLWIVTILILGIAILFFWEEIKAGGSHLANGSQTYDGDFQCNGLSTFFSSTRMLHRVYHLYGLEPS